MINKSGYKIIFTNGILLITLILFLTVYYSFFLLIITFLTSFIFIFHFFFFRDPERKTLSNKNLIYSPADGKVIKIAQVKDDIFLNNNGLLISIFMSVFNVHVNRIPCIGKVDYLQYIPGKYKAAFVDESSEMNEQMVIGIQTQQGKILMKQIAGIIARRIDCFLKKGDIVNTGERFGMIKYGSRVDLIIPSSSKLHVKMNQKVIAGETIIGEFIGNKYLH